MAVYVWRTGSGQFDEALNWLDSTLGDVRPPPPGTADIAAFSAPGGTVSGNGSVYALTINPSAGSAWVFTGSVTAEETTISSQTTLTTGAVLTLTGVPPTTMGYPPYSGTINALLTLVDATLDSSAGQLTVGYYFASQPTGAGDLDATADSTATALDLSIGVGTAGTVTVTGAGSTLTTAADMAYPTGGYVSIGDQATVNGTATPGNGTLDIEDGGAVTVGDVLNVGEDAGSTGTVTIGSGGSLTLDAGYSELGNLSGSTGSLTINSGGTFTLAGGQFVVGNQAGATGTLTINAGGRFVSTVAGQTANYLLDIGSSAATSTEPAAMGTVTVQGQGALLDMGNNPIRVGYSGSGTLNILDGGVVDAGSIDSSSDATSIASLSVGRGGSGTVNISGAGSTMSLIGGLYAGRGAGGDGVINVTQGGKLKVSLDPTGNGNIVIGSGNSSATGGTGALNVKTSGTVVTAGELIVGLNGDTGTATLDTAGSVTASEVIVVGTGTTFTGGNGTVVIEGGAGLHSTGPHLTGNSSVIIANAASTTGKITVTGAGSVLDAGGDRISVGNRGQGMLLVEDGASASAGSTLYSDAASEAGFSVGNTSTGNGTATVAGVRSSLDVNGAITLGGTMTATGGTGTLMASDGGAVTATGLTLWSGGTLDADGASLIEIGTGTAATGGVAILAGSQLTAHGGTITAAIANAGTLSNDGALTITGAFAGAGAIALGASSTTDISGSIAGQTVNFIGANGSLALATFTGSTTISGAQIGDIVDLVGRTDVTATPTTVAAGSGTLIFTNLAADTHVVLKSDGHGGMEATIACYCPGTAILTERGEIPVKALAIGDRVVTLSGALEPIRWIGHRSYAGAFVAGNHLMLPVCIKAGALADGVPRRDLHVSPGHAMFVDGQLIPAWRLINGVSIVQAETVDSVSYYHVELGRHDVIWAEGAPAESFLDDGCRGQFYNAAAFDQLYPEALPMIPVQSRLEDGFGLQAVQARLAARARVMIPVEPIGGLRGYIDIATPGRVTGWAQDEGSPEEPVALAVTVDGFPVLCCLANAFRADLRQAGLGSGCHAFDMALPAGLRGAIEVRRVTDGTGLPCTDAVNGPEILQAA